MITIEKMSRLIIFLFILFFIACESNDSEKNAFSFDRIELLNLGELEGFWEEGEIIDTSFNKGSSLYDDPGFVNGIQLKGEEKYIVVAVFQSKAIALNHMDARIKTVACVILPGTSNEVRGEWWYTECIPNSVFVNKWNTIVQVAYGAGNFESVKEILYNTANEVIHRIDRFGD